MDERADREAETPSSAAKHDGNPGPEWGDTSARAEVERECSEFMAELIRRTEKRLLEGDDSRRFERGLAALQADRAALQARLAAREQLLGAIYSSAGWRLLQTLRGLVGRRW